MATPTSEQASKMFCHPPSPLAIFEHSETEVGRTDGWSEPGGTATAAGATPRAVAQGGSIGSTHPT
eukprot:3682604-Pleurochrysis_carterae.AAC.1